MFPFLSSLATDVTGQKLTIKAIADFPQTPEDHAAAADLKSLLDQHGSNKSNFMSYHHFYGAVLKDREAVYKIFEIGLGTNNIDVISNMGSEARPGASLRAFRDFCVNAQIYGADVDTRVLFKEDRIETFFVNQTDPDTFTALEQVLPDDFDMMIDDGLHSPNANVESLRFFLKKIKIGGWAVIEDIGLPAVPVWEVVAVLLGDAYSCRIFSDNSMALFAAQRMK